MAALSDYLEGKLLDHVFRATAYTAPTTVYCALFTAAPSDAGGGTEVTGGAYARVAVTSATTSWSAPGAAGLIDNAAAITFPEATANWGTVTHVGLFDAATAGNLLMHGALTTAQTVNSGGTFSFAVGALDLSLA